MNKALTVFLCSTFADLSEERERVLDAIQRLQLQHDSMEYFGARADLPIETCLAEVRQSDVLVVIVGHRYGSLVSELGISFSEAEYREGYRLGKPCLVYLRDESVPVLVKHVERDPEKLRLLERWKEALASRHTVALFSDSQRLAVQVAADLSRTIQAVESERSRLQTANRPQAAILSELGALVEEAFQKGLPQRAVVSAVRRTISDLLAKSGSRSPLVFLSHSHADKSTVRKVAKGLKDAGIDVWIDEAELMLGDSIFRNIEKGLDSADFLAFFLSRASLASPWARKELDIAISRQISEDRGAVVIPILLDDAEIPALLKSVMYLDMRDRNIDAGISRLVSAIERHQLQRLHTYDAPQNRYFNPPAQVPILGRQLKGHSFLDLVSQLNEDEILIGLYRNQAGALVATHLRSKGRMDEMESLWAPAEGYYGVSSQDANKGMSA